MQIKNMLYKLLRNFNDFGFWLCFKKSISYLCKPFYENMVLVVYNVEIEKVVVQEASKNDFNFKLVNNKDTYLINQIEKMEEWLQGKVEGKLQRGGICMAIIDRDKVIGFYLTALGEIFIPLLKMKVIIEPCEAWGEQVTIKKKYRRNGLATELKSKIYSEFKKSGIKTVYGHAALYNKASLKSAEKFKTQHLAVVQYLRYLNYRILKIRKLLSNYYGGRSEPFYRSFFKKDMKRYCYEKLYIQEEYIFTAKTSDFCA